MWSMLWLPSAWCALVDFAASYYQRGIGEIALSVLPAELRRLGNAAIANRLARLEKRLKRYKEGEPVAPEPPPALSPAQVAISSGSTLRTSPTARARVAAVWLR